MILNGTESHSRLNVGISVLCVRSDSGIFSFQLGQSNGCATHTDRHKHGWNLNWLCYSYVINIH